jgi:DnaD/phage-associated family protein
MRNLYLADKFIVKVQNFSTELLAIMLVEYAVGLNKANIRFIEKTAIQWLNAGVEDIASAEEYMQNSAKAELCSKTLAAAFGIRDRKLNKTERDLALLWINEHSFDRKMLETAYDLCVDATGSYNIKYIKGIIERWIKDGVKTAEDIKKANEKKPKIKTPKQDYSAIDKDLLEKMLNVDD